jgi:hypothetical protein
LTFVQHNYMQHHIFSSLKPEANSLLGSVCA